MSQRFFYADPLNNRSRRARTAWLNYWSLILCQWTLGKAVREWVTSVPSGP